MCSHRQKHRGFIFADGLLVRGGRARWHIITVVIMHEPTVSGLCVNSLISSKPFAYEKGKKKSIRSVSLPWISEINCHKPGQTTDMLELYESDPLFFLIWPLRGAEPNRSKGPNPKIEKLYLQISSQNFQQILNSPYPFLPPLRLRFSHLFFFFPPLP